MKTKKILAGALAAAVVTTSLPGMGGLSSFLCKF